MTIEHQQVKSLLDKERKAAERQEAESALAQPLAYLFQNGYVCHVEPDGTEVFSNSKCVVRVPPSCVQWIKRPVLDPNATDLTEAEKQELDDLRRLMRSPS